VLAFLPFALMMYSQLLVPIGFVGVVLGPDWAGVVVGLTLRDAKLYPALVEQGAERAFAAV